ncbi:unnamed protein product [Ectocarpus fasciculatus]
MHTYVERIVGGKKPVRSSSLHHSHTPGVMRRGADLRIGWPCAIINGSSSSYNGAMLVFVARCGGNETLSGLVGLVLLTPGVRYNQSGTSCMQRLSDRMRKAQAVAHGALHVT